MTNNVLTTFRRIRSVASDLSRVGRFVERHQLNLRFRRAVRATRQIKLARGGDVQVHVLAGHRHVHETIGTIQSLYRFTPMPWPVVVHDDGSISDADTTLLESKLAGVRVIRRPEADVQVLGMLEKQGLPRCTELRRTFVFALKLFDVEFYGHGKAVLMLDTDILFHKQPDELLEALAVPQDRWIDRYNVDLNSSYAWDEATINRHTGGMVLPSVNAGLIAFRRPELHWERYEQWLSNPAPMTSPWHLEQTLHAIDMSQRGAKPLAPEYDVCFRASWRDDYDEWIKTAPNGHEVFSQHYCGSLMQRRFYYRHYLQYVAPDYRR